MKYNLVTFGIPNDSVDRGIQMGLCLPSSCERGIIQQAIQTALKQLHIPLVV